MTDIYEDCLTDDLYTGIKSKNHEYKYKSLRGKTKYMAKSRKFTIKETTIKNLIDCFYQDIIVIPTIQREIDNTKIDNMILTYNDDSETFNFLTNPIQLVYMDNYEKYLLIDGQHRFCMYRQLLESLLIEEDFEILINITTTNDKEIIYKMYKHFNYDIQDEIKTIEEFKIDFKKIFKVLEYDKFSNINCKNIKKYFSQVNNQYIYTFDEFITILYDKNYIELFESVNDAYEYLIETNNIFCKKFYTEDNKNDIKFKKDELNSINRNIIFNLKQNNFIKLLLDQDIKYNSFEASHSWIDKKKKYSISYTCNI